MTLRMSRQAGLAAGVGAIVVCLLAAAVVAATVFDRGQEDAAPAVPAPATVAQPPVTGPPSTSVSAPTPPLVRASAEGVTVTSAGSMPVRVSTAPAAAAYGVGSEFVVFQNRSPAGDSFPPLGDGPVRLWSAGTVRDLPQGPGAVRLLDAGIVADRPVALFGERPPSTGLADSFEELVRVGLRDRTRTVVVRRPAWETGHPGSPPAPQRRRGRPHRFRGGPDGRPVAARHDAPALDRAGGLRPAGRPGRARKLDLDGAAGHGS
jgi:hypothetical protein